MTYKFPSPEWLDELHQKLNNDTRYAEIAHRWEGDIIFVIEADDQLKESVCMYFDLWHGASRGVEYDIDLAAQNAAFTISAPYANWVRILEGELNPIQAMATMKLRIKGSMAYIMRNVPTVLEFTRCAQDISFSR